VGALAAHNWLGEEAERRALKRVATAPVIVAAADLPAGQKLALPHLALVNWPRSSLPAGYFSNANDLADRVLTKAVQKGEPVTLAKLSGKGEAAGLSSMLPPGFRAMTVRVDEVIGVGGFVQPGDLVDVLVTVNQGSFREDPATRTVLQGVLVLTVGQKVEENPKATRPTVTKVKVVTLQLAPDQAERLALAASEGKVLLALRNKTDLADQATKGLHLTQLMPTPPTGLPQAEAKPAPVQTKPKVLARIEAKTEPAPARLCVEVIKGVVRSEQVL
jgi:pilus assembly protein CpaB